MRTRIVKTVIVHDYKVSEKVFGLDFLVVESGELEGREFPIWDGGILEGSSVTVQYIEERSWRTLWRWTPRITVQEPGGYICTVTEESAESVLERPIIVESY